MKRLLFLLALFLFPIQMFALGEGQRIDLGVSPIRHEITMDKGTTVTKSITFFNNADVPYSIYMSSEDCQAAVDYGTPKCTPYSGATDSIHLSTWIQFSGPTTFTVPPKSEKTISFTIAAPANASPGGHYAAVFFNNPDTTGAANTVKMVRRIGTLLLVQVNGVINYDTKIGQISAGAGGGMSQPSPSGLVPTDSPWSIKNLQDLIAGKADITSFLDTAKKELNPFWSAPELPSQAFLFQFSIPLSNSGTTHIKPTGRVEIYDDEGTLLKSIGKESIKNADGVYLGEKVVDYLPINDEDGNILPNTARVFTVDWQGFAYEGIENGKTAIHFQSPGVYYSQMQDTGKMVLWPWEKLTVVKKTRTFHAKITLQYAADQGKIVPLSTDSDVGVEYYVVEKSLNYGLLWIVGLLLLLMWLLLRRRDRKIKILKKEVAVLEEEVDELEKAKHLAKQALAKKKAPPKKEVTEAAPVAKKPTRAARKKPEPETVTPEAPKKPTRTAAKKPAPKKTDAA